MQRHPFQYRAPGSGDFGRPLSLKKLLEANSFRTSGNCGDDHQEWNPHRDPDPAGELRRSRLSLWKSAPRGRGRFFYDWIAAFGAGYVVAATWRVQEQFTGEE